MPKFINRTSHTISLNINRSPPQGSTPKFLNQAAHAHTISLNVSRSPPGSAQQQQQQQQGNTAASPSTPPCSPNGSPNNSPITPGTRAPYSSPNRSPTAVEVQTKKVRFIGRVSFGWGGGKAFQFRHFKQSSFLSILHMFPLLQNNFWQLRAHV